MIENSSQDRKVRSAAKKTLGSTRTGTWIPAHSLADQCYSDLERGCCGLEDIYVRNEDLLFPFGALNRLAST